MPIRVLLVDDSATTLLLWSQLIGRSPDMQVVGQAINGIQAIKMVEQLHPDVVLMDVMMPGMDGLQATREIMDAKPTPIVVVSANLGSFEMNIAFEAMNAGAVSVMKKPGITQSLNLEDSTREFVNTLRAMSAVRVIRHPKSSAATALERAAPPTPRQFDVDLQPEIVVIASSTGGPQALGEIIKNLPTGFNLPIVIVQHITPDFVPSMVNWLGSVSPLPVCLPQVGERPRPGTIYIAPGRQHLQLTCDRRFEFTGTPANVPHIPSGDVLLKSVAQAYGSQAVGVVLTGMGSDGARGLRALFEKGAMTIAQDEASCVVFGMPNEAIMLGAARQVLPPREILKLLLQYVV